MNYVKKIVLLLFIGSFCFATVDAQQRKTRRKAKTAIQRTANRKKNNAEASKHKKAATQKSAPVHNSLSNQSASRMAREGLSDTASPKVVTVTSSFKPSLKNAAKVNFTAASPVIDSSRVPVVYTIPAQNLLFSYQPVPIKPLALAVDTGFTWDNDHYLKAGIGNFSTAFAEGAFSFGDGKKSITNLRANFFTTKGNLPAQQFNKFGLDVVSVLNTNHNNEWTTKAWYENSTRYFYGYQPATLAYKKDDLLQRFNNGGIEVGLQNKAPNDFDITYHPQIQLRYFADNRDGKEYSLLAKAPIRKGFGKIYAFDLGLTADISKATMPMTPDNLVLKNNLYYVSPSIQFNTPNFKLNLGIQPSWDNQNFSTLPNITAEAKIGETNLLIEAGWKGYYNKNTYYSLAGYNPWIGHLTNDILNTKVGEQYAGFKGAAGNHLTYNARVSFLRLNNQPLFVNDQTDGKSFNVLYEPKMQVMKLHGEVGYTVQEKFSLLAGATYQRFTSLERYDKAWGLLPFEVTGTLKWKVLKDLQLKADAFLWDGSYYRDKSLQSFKLDPAADINFGAEFAVMPKLNLWLQLNNILNNKYQRWNQYEVLGLNVLGGVVYSFR